MEFQTEVSLTNGEDVFQLFKSPDKNVRNLTIQGKLDSSSRADLQLNKLFPELCQLTLDSIRVSDLTILDVHFPHLETIIIRFPPMEIEQIQASSEFKATEPAIKKFLEKNPQIKAVELIYCPHHYHIMVNNVLPSFRSLKTVYIE